MTNLAPGPSDLIFSRRLRASRRNVWRCWTEPDLLMQWFCPKPWHVTRAVIELYPGGSFLTDMAGPDGAEHPAGEGGVFLEVVPMERLAFTSALSKGWRPTPAQAIGFQMSAVVALRDAEDGGTLYDVQVLHADAAARDQHLAMGFHDGWGAAAVQLDDLALTL
jgi:uncharacterized protein YndB with AHSA1/START domain